MQLRSAEADAEEKQLVLFCKRADKMCLNAFNGLQLKKRIEILIEMELSFDWKKQTNCLTLVQRTFGSEN